MITHITKIPLFIYFFNVIYIEQYNILLPLILSVFIGTFFGILPTLFIGTALGSGIEKIIDENEIAPSFFDILTSKDVYYPILGFFIILIIALIVRKKNYQNKI